jgi:beta-phosphoglucomutase-like phosphatase (HAD superfamily)
MNRRQMDLNSFLPAAVIFDMDGVLVDTNPFHIQKWQTLLAARRYPDRCWDRPMIPSSAISLETGPLQRTVDGLAKNSRRGSEELSLRTPNPSRESKG